MAQGLKDVKRDPDVWVAGGGDYLGVCFGPLVTVNSPASRVAHPVNWESIVWHEFCHTVTLTKTKNKMPRWLSEGDIGIRGVGGGGVCIVGAADDAGVSGE